MTMAGQLIRMLLLLVSVAILVSCGAGSGGTSIADGGIGGTGISRGPITGFGSIFVNDTEFDTTNSVIVVNGTDAGAGDAAVLANFEVGKVVRVEGSYTDTSGNAVRVVFNSNVRGPVQSVTDIDANSREITVMGQPVIVDGTTNIVSGNVNDLVVGNFLEVSGLVDAAGNIRASFVERLSDIFVDGGDVEVEGFITNLNLVAESFVIGAVMIDYGSADISGLTAGPANGQSVRVKGTYLLGMLTAMEIVEASELGTDTSQEVETQGFVSSVVSPDEFVMGIQLVRTNPATRYKGGLAADIKVGAKLKVEGSLASGIISAEEISFKDSIKLESRVEAIGLNTITLAGLAGITVTVNSLTKVDGIVSDFGGIGVGNLAKVRGRISGSSSSILASKIEVENASAPTEVKLQGPVDNVADPFITVLGLVIDTTGLEFEDDTGKKTTATEFFNMIDAGDTVDAKGNLDAGGTLTWEELELEGKL